MSGLSGKTFLEKTGSQAGSRSKFRTLNINSVYSGKSLLSSRSNVSSKHGLQSLGKATAIARRMPPPANLPSLKSESAGQDPAVSIVPSGVSGWGTQQADPTKSAPLTTGQTSVVSTSHSFTPSYTGSSSIVSSSDYDEASGQRSANGDLARAKAPAVTGWGTRGALGQQGTLGVTRSQTAPGFAISQSAQDFPSLASQQAKSENKDVLSLRPQKAGSWKTGGGWSGKLTDGQVDAEDERSRASSVDGTLNVPRSQNQRAPPQSPPFPPSYAMRSPQAQFNASANYHQASNYPALTLPPSQYAGPAMPYLQRTMPPWDLKRPDTPTATILKPRNQTIADGRGAKGASAVDPSGRPPAKTGEAVSMWNSSRRSESSPSGTSCSRETAKDYLYHADNWVLNEYAHEQRTAAQSCDRYDEENEHWSTESDRHRSFEDHSTGQLQHRQDEHAPRYYSVDEEAPPSPSAMSARFIGYPRSDERHCPVATMSPQRDGRLSDARYVNWEEEEEEQYRQQMQRNARNSAIEKSWQRRRLAQQSSASSGGTVDASNSDYAEERGFVGGKGINYYSDGGEMMECPPEKGLDTGRRQMGRSTRDSVLRTSARAGQAQQRFLETAQEERTYDTMGRSSERGQQQQGFDTAGQQKNGDKRYSLHDRQKGGTQRQNAVPEIAKRPTPSGQVQRGAADSRWPLEGSVTEHRQRSAASLTVGSDIFRHVNAQCPPRQDALVRRSESFDSGATKGMLNQRMSDKEARRNAEKASRFADNQFPDSKQVSAHGRDPSREAIGTIRMPPDEPSDRSRRFSAWQQQQQEQQRTQQQNGRDAKISPPKETSQNCDPSSGQSRGRRQAVQSKYPKGLRYACDVKRTIGDWDIEDESVTREQQRFSRGNQNEGRKGIAKFTFTRGGGGRTGGRPYQDEWQPGGARKGDVRLEETSKGSKEAAGGVGLESKEEVREDKRQSRSGGNRQQRFHRYGRTFERSSKARTAGGPAGARGRDGGFSRSMAQAAKGAESREDGWRESASECSDAAARRSKVGENAHKQEPRRPQGRGGSNRQAGQRNRQQRVNRGRPGGDSSQGNARNKDLAKEPSLLTTGSAAASGDFCRDARKTDAGGQSSEPQTGDNGDVGGSSIRFDDVAGAYNAPQGVQEGPKKERKFHGGEKNKGKGTSKLGRQEKGGSSKGGRSSKRSVVSKRKDATVPEKDKGGRVLFANPEKSRVHWMTGSLPDSCFNVPVSLFCDMRTPPTSASLSRASGGPTLPEAATAPSTTHLPSKTGVEIWGAPDPVPFSGATQHSKCITRPCKVGQRDYRDKSAGGFESEASRKVEYNLGKTKAQKNSNELGNQNSSYLVAAELSEKIAASVKRVWEDSGVAVSRTGDLSSRPSAVTDVEALNGPPGGSSKVSSTDGNGSREAEPVGSTSCSSSCAGVKADGPNVAMVRPQQLLLDSFSQSLEGGAVEDAMANEANHYATDVFFDPSRGASGYAQYAIGTKGQPEYVGSAQAITRPPAVMGGAGPYSQQSPLIIPQNVPFDASVMGLYGQPPADPAGHCASAYLSGYGGSNDGSPPYMFGPLPGMRSTQPAASGAVNAGYGIGHHQAPNLYARTSTSPLVVFQDHHHSTSIFNQAHVGVLNAQPPPPQPHGSALIGCFPPSQNSAVPPTRAHPIPSLPGLTSGPANAQSNLVAAGTYSLLSLSSNGPKPGASVAQPTNGYAGFGNGGAVPQGRPNHCSWSTAVSQPVKLAKEPKCSKVFNPTIRPPTHQQRSAVGAPMGGGSFAGQACQEQRKRPGASDGKHQHQQQNQQQQEREERQQGEELQQEERQVASDGDLLMQMDRFINSGSAASACDRAGELTGAGDDSQSAEAPPPVE